MTCNGIITYAVRVVVLHPSIKREGRGYMSPYIHWFLLIINLTKLHTQARETKAGKIQVYDL